MRIVYVWVGMAMVALALVMPADLFAQWAHNIGGTSIDVGYDIAVDGSGNVYGTGYFQGTDVDFDPGAGTANLSSNGGVDIFFAKYDASGAWYLNLYYYYSEVGWDNASRRYGFSVRLLQN